VVWGFTELFPRMVARPAKKTRIDRHTSWMA